VVGAVARPAITLRASGATRRGGSREGSPNSLGIPCASLSADDDDNERMRFAHTGLLHCRRQNRASARRRGTPHLGLQQGLEGWSELRCGFGAWRVGIQHLDGRPRGCWRKGSRVGAEYGGCRREDRRLGEYRRNHRCGLRKCHRPQSTNQGRDQEAQHQRNGQRDEHLPADIVEGQQRSDDACGAVTE